jgi:uncharacterized membrane protein YoaK (UPF0700 family)
MFSHEGPARSSRSNSVLAGYLAFVAGFANAAGLLLLGVFTSHVTGNVARVSVDLARREPRGALQAGLLVLLFLCGAVAASLLVETNLIRRTSSAYGAALLVQGALLCTFVVTGTAGLLSFCMGMQNSLVTRLSGSVVRTTHLTGVITDLGIELARWTRWQWSRMFDSQRSAASRNPAARPTPARSLLLVTVAVSFTVGGLLGAIAAPAWGPRSIAIPGGAILLAALYAFASETSVQRSTGLG